MVLFFMKHKMESTNSALKVESVCFAAETSSALVYS